MTKKIDFYGEELNTYKANFHIQHKLGREIFSSGTDQSLQ